MADLRRCENCRKDIPVQTYELHVSFCTRNVWRCPKCDDCFQKNEKEQHEKTVHALVTCVCGEVVEQGRLERHKAEACLRRQVECEFCEMSLPMLELMDHQEYCGSRTDNCLQCLKIVKIRDMDRHLASGCQVGGVDAAAQPSPSSASAGTNLMADGMLPSPGIFACPHCGADNDDFELLRVHIAAVCPIARVGAVGGQRSARSRPAAASSSLANPAAAAAPTGGRSRAGRGGGGTRRTNADWEAEMQTALAGQRNRRAGGGAGTGAGALMPRVALSAAQNVSSSSEDEDWSPGGDRGGGGAGSDGSPGADVYSSSGNVGHQMRGVDEDLERALLMSRQEAEQAHSGAQTQQQQQQQ